MGDVLARCIAGSGYFRFLFLGFVRRWLYGVYYGHLFWGGVVARKAAVQIDGFEHLIDRRLYHLCTGFAAVSYTHLDVYKRQVIKQWKASSGVHTIGSPRTLKDVLISTP